MSTSRAAVLVIALVASVPAHGEPLLEGARELPVGVALVLGGQEHRITCLLTGAAPADVARSFISRWRARGWVTFSHVVPGETLVSAFATRERRQFLVVVRAHAEGAIAFHVERSTETPPARYAPSPLEGVLTGGPQ
jgi:hypothetical protein